MIPNWLKGTLLTDWYDNGKDQIAFCRGQRGFIAINNDVTDMNVSLKVSLNCFYYYNIIWKLYCRLAFPLVLIVT
jgi:alpha-amylase